jgi:hypothetical protein
VGTTPSQLPIEAFDPETRRTRPFRIMKDDLEAVLKVRPRHKLFELRGDATPTKAGELRSGSLVKAM